MLLHDCPYVMHIVSYNYAYDNFIGKKLWVCVICYILGSRILALATDFLYCYYMGGPLQFDLLWLR